MKENNDKSRLKSFSGMIVFFCMAAFLWLTIKLSGNYTVNLPFKIFLTEQPANQIIPNNDRLISATVEATGFKLLNYYFVSRDSREINVSLKESKYKKNGDDRYSMNTNYIKDYIANFMEISTNEISLSESEFEFTMYKLASKRVKVLPQTQLVFESQYNYYGNPTVMPDSITINGAYNTIRDINHVYTQVVAEKNVNGNFKVATGIQLDDDVYSDTEEVEVNVRVEKYTESEVIVPINTLNISRLNLFPDKVSVRYVVALNDYPNVNSLSFDIEIDTTDFGRKALLPLRLAGYPTNTTIISVTPKEVEYVLTK